MVGKELIVFVDSAVWLNEMKRYSRAKVLANVQARVGRGSVTSVQFAMDPDEP